MNDSAASLVAASTHGHESSWLLDVLDVDVDVDVELDECVCECGHSMMNFGNFGDEPKPIRKS